MTSFLSRLSNKQKRVALLASVVLLCLGLTYAVQEYKLKDLEQMLEVQVSEQRVRLLGIAESAERSGASASLESTLRDCQLDERAEFDVLLGNLDTGLSTTELDRLDRLFGRCGNFFAERKSILVADLEREIEVYESYIEQLQTISTKALFADYQLEGWKQLAQSEKNQAELFSKLVSLQNEIIKTLLEGKSADSDEIKLILSNVAETRQTLLASYQETSELRVPLTTE